MTLPTTTSRVDYLGDGTSTAFPVPYRFFGADELRVVERVIATGAETDLTLGANYTVTGGGGADGSVSAVVAPATGRQWTILRNTRRTQAVDIQPNDPLPAETLERSLDRQMAVVQELERDNLRSVRIPETDAGGSMVLPTSGARALRVLGFDASGNPIPVVPDTGGLVVTPYTAGLLASMDAPEARGVLDAYSKAEVDADVATRLAKTANLSDVSDVDAARAALGATAVGAGVFTAANVDAARAALGATAVGAGVFTAANAAAARVALAAPAAPVNGGTGPGAFSQQAPGAGAALTLPAGGTWAFYAIYFASGGTLAGQVGGVSAGGATVGGATAGHSWVGFAWRIA